jgi:AraC-like DNA-binding protein
MEQALLEQLKKITPEEQAILDGGGRIQRELYTSLPGFVVDSRKLLERGKLIDLRPATRFIHFPRHRHNYVELVYQCAGTTTHILNDRETITLRPGDLLFLNQTVYHEILPAAEGDLAVNFIILPQFFDHTISIIERENVLRDFLLSVLSGEATQSSFLYVQAADILPVQNLMENMIWTLIYGKSGVNTINQTTMSLLFLNLSTFAERIGSASTHDSPQDQVFFLLRYIDLHYKQGTLAEAAQQLSLPPYAVSRLLKKHTGSNFKELLQQRKLQQAAYLLSNTPVSVDIVLESIGYDNSSYFYRKFREKYGCSPKEYRQATQDPA